MVPEPSCSGAPGWSIRPPGRTTSPTCSVDQGHRPRSGWTRRCSTATASCWHPVSSTSTPTCGNPAGRTRRPSSHAARPRSASPPPRWRTRIRCRQRGRDPRGPRAGPAAGTCDVFPPARSRAASAERRWPSSARWSTRASGQRRRALRAQRACAPQRLTYVRAFEGVVIAEHCEDASLAEGGQMHEGPIVVARARGPATGGRGGRGRARSGGRAITGAGCTCAISSAGSVEMVRRARPRVCASRPRSRTTSCSPRRISSPTTRT